MRRLYERVSLTAGVRERGPGRIVIAVAGEIDSDNCAELRCELSSLVAEAGGCDVALDLSALTFIGSAGVRELVLCRQEVEQHGGAFEISQAHENVRVVLTLCGLAALLHPPAA
ncbi:hypothetical protein Aab01nite_64330 [Paractinoplanes abujensis]|uniref:Anti-sigma factor antagonist n=1 Tax=Paractinoplanes abujensis TaxID=882441 RepID=A0A7W7CQ44_9ACTN|nr:STAS domain-containing protein [Actinoplanes abujensis]MBB4692656.1 anti-anti-sigma factor [Actinoplanes abujensis]GID22843.1 hypothetical protein Aab01nite_64330 [Actinoplanes abujensis]